MRSSASSRRSSSAGAVLRRCAAAAWRPCPRPTGWSTGECVGAATTSCSTAGSSIGRREMFSGIVEELGTVGPAEGGLALTVACSTVLEGTILGDSIAVDGVCLTVSALTPTSFTANIQPVTARLSTLGELRAGDRVNLERAVAAGQRIGGHY